MSYFTPRLSSSIKWSEIPDEFLAKVRAVFQGQFKAQAAVGEFIVDGQIYTEEVVLRVGYVEQGRLKQINFEASMNLKGASNKAFSAAPTDITADGEVLAPQFETQNADEVADGADAQSTLMDRLFSCVDILGSLMEEYFEGGEDIDKIDIPLHWKGYEFEGEEIYLQYSTVNTKLEEEANRLLGLIGDSLVNERESDEDALTAAQVDSELALDIQKAIRNGTYRPEGSDANDPN